MQSIIKSNKRLRRKSVDTNRLLLEDRATSVDFSPPATNCCTWHWLSSCQLQSAFLVVIYFETINCPDKNLKAVFFLFDTWRRINFSGESFSSKLFHEAELCCFSLPTDDRMSGIGENCEREKPKRKYFFSFSCGVEKRRESGEKICCFEASSISRIGTVAQSQRGRSIKNPLLATSISSHVKSL